MKLKSKFSKSAQKLVEPVRQLEFMKKLWLRAKFLAAALENALHEKFSSETQKSKCSRRLCEIKLAAKWAPALLLKYKKASKSDAKCNF